MKDQWEGDQRPAAPTGMSLAEIMGNNLWGGWAGAPGETVYINPTSPGSPLYHSGITGTGDPGRFSGGAPGVGGPAATTGGGPSALPSLSRGASVMTPASTTPASMDLGSYILNGATTGAGASSAPWWLGPVVSGATGLVGTYLQTRAATKAAEAQTAAGQQALALQKQMYDQTRADLAPYRTMGQQAMQTLGGLMGFSGSGTPTYEQSQLDAQRPYNPTTGKGLLDGYVQANPQTGFLEPTEYAKSVGKGFDTTGVEPQTQSAYLTGGNEVTRQMRAPDGSVQDIPISLVPHYQAQGAQIVRG